MCKLIESQVWNTGEASDIYGTAVRIFGMVEMPFPCNGSLFRCFHYSDVHYYASKKKRGKRRAKLQTTATIWFPHILPFPAMISLLVCTHFWWFSHCGCFGGRYHLNILQKLWANVDYKWSEDVKQLISNQKFDFLKFWHLFLGSAQHNQFWRW